MSVTFSKVMIERPPGTIRLTLSIDALDARSREIARSTFIRCGNQTMSVRRYEALENGDLLLVIPANDWEFTEGPPISNS